MLVHYGVLSLVNGNKSTHVSADENHQIKKKLWYNKPNENKAACLM